MFEAFMLVCMIGNSNVCHTIADIEGPYKTQRECIMRVNEMAYELKDYMPEYVPVNYKCNQKGIRI
jgi:hypothetical protein